MTHTTKRCLKHSGLIIENLVSKGNRTPDHCYNDSMTIMPLAQTSCSTQLLCYITLDQRVALTAR